jgi:excisionase family DNA binding protein
MEKSGGKIRIFSALEVANICGVVNQTAINWIRNGHLKAFTTPGGQYRVYAEDLMEFLSSRGMHVPEEIYRLLKIDVDWDAILVVEDDRELNGLIRDWLLRKQARYKVIQAFDGFEAGKALTVAKPGTVILDLGLPGIDGYELCKKIKEDSSLGCPFIVIITGLEIDDGRKAELLKWSDAYLTKPLEFEALNETLATLEQKIMR